VFQGERDPDAEPYIPVKVGADSPLAFRDLDAAFARAMRGGVVTWTVVTPDGLARSRRMRYASGLGDAVDIDPMASLYAFYDINFTALDPYWHTDEVVTPFVVAGLANMLPTTVTTLASAVLHINETHSTGGAVLTNPGDVAADWSATIDGPYTKATIGIGDDRVVLDTPIALGEQRTVQTNPPDILDEALESAWLEATDASFEALPAGADVPITLDIVGGTDGQTAVSFSFTPSYRRQW
jgi:hypothetical protein